MKRKKSKESIFIIRDERKQKAKQKNVEREGQIWLKKKKKVNPDLQRENEKRTHNGTQKEQMK